VCGITEKNDGVTANAFLGIPFAAPPTGALRWAAPAPPANRTEVLAATTAASMCPQIITPVEFTEFDGAEDCLYLNVWTPQGATAAPKPVVVYIPGGGFLTGAGSLPGYNGAYLAASSDVVVVTINYRLGALGFMRYQGPDATIEGNFGIQDQMAALNWVKSNIASFGGDPSKLTMWGESAGAVSTALHLFSIPESNAMIRSAIMDSNVAGSPLPTAGASAQVGTDFVGLLCQYQTTPGCPKTVAWLRSLPLETIMTAENSAAPSQGIHGLFTSTNPISWAPTVGVAPIVGQPILGYQPGATAKPFVMGHNKDEGAFFTPQPQWMTATEYSQWLTASFGRVGAAAVLGYEAGGKKPYNPATYVFDPGAQMTPTAQAYMRVITDGLVASPNIVTSQRVGQQMAAANQPMLGYEFNYVASFNYNGLPQCSPQSLNVCHSYELPFAFNNMVQLNGSQWETVNVPEAERDLARTMAKAWTGFVKDPTASGWGYPAMTDPVKGPYVQFGSPVGSVEDMGSQVNFDLWKPFLAASIARG
jgi:carboxylesterase type B